MPIIPAGEFRRSKKLYAVKQDGLIVDTLHNDFTGHRQVNRQDEVVHHHMYKLPAVWFRKRSNGSMAAFVGTLWDSKGGWGQENAVAPFTDVQSFLNEYENARYGGTPLGCIDENGGRWWAKEYADDYSKQEAVTPLLQQMLVNFGEVPEGYQGWYALTEKIYH